MSSASEQNDEANSLLLTEPKTQKTLLHGHSFGFGSVQGWRKSNEDYHRHLVPVDDQAWKLWSYFAIFDGHNGIDTAKNASELLGKHLIDALNDIVPKPSDAAHPIHSSRLNLNEVTRVIKQTFLHLDKELVGLVNDQSGSVCIATMIGPENIYLINVGDSRAIIISKEGRVLEFTRDHKPNVRKEKERIYRAGGRVTEHPDDVPRVQDMLAVSRAFGDYSIDKHIIPPSPDIIEHGKGDKSPAAYVILACDGLWDVMSNEDVAQFVAKRVEHSSLETIAGQLLDHALQLNTMDNVSVYLIKL